MGFKRLDAEDFVVSADSIKMSLKFNTKYALQV